VCDDIFTVLLWVPEATETAPHDMTRRVWTALATGSGKTISEQPAVLLFDTPDSE